MPAKFKDLRTGTMFEFDQKIWIKLTKDSGEAEAFAYLAVLDWNQYPVRPTRKFDPDELVRTVAMTFREVPATKFLWAWV